MCVKDTFHMLTNIPRTMRGDCYCVRCCKPVPYQLGEDGRAQYLPDPVVMA